MGSSKRRRTSADQNPRNKRASARDVPQEEDGVWEDDVVEPALVLSPPESERKDGIDGEVNKEEDKEDGLEEYVEQEPEEYLELEPKEDLEEYLVEDSEEGPEEIPEEEQNLTEEEQYYVNETHTSRTSNDNDDLEFYKQGNEFKPVLDMPGGLGNHAAGEESSSGEESNRRTKTPRLWSEDTVIKVLEGMIRFQSLYGTHADNDMRKFHDFIVLERDMKVSKQQLADKIRRLKNKYEIYQDKLDRDEFVPFGEKPHERECFLLSSRIWDAQYQNTCTDVDVDAPESGGYSAGDHYEDGAEKEVENIYISRNSEEVQEHFWSLFPCFHESLNLDHFSQYTLSSFRTSFLKQRLSLIGSSAAANLEEKWRELFIAETQVQLMRARLIQEQTRVILEAIE